MKSHLAKMEQDCDNDAHFPIMAARHSFYSDYRLFRSKDVTKQLG